MRKLRPREERSLSLGKSQVITGIPFSLSINPYCLLSLPTPLPCVVGWGQSVESWSWGRVGMCLPLGHAWHEKHALWINSSEPWGPAPSRILLNLIRVHFTSSVCFPLWKCHPHLIYYYSGGASGKKCWWDSGARARDWGVGEHGRASLAASLLRVRLPRERSRRACGFAGKGNTTQQASEVAAEAVAHTFWKGAAQRKEAHFAAGWRRRGPFLAPGAWEPFAFTVHKALQAFPNGRCYLHFPDWEARAERKLGLATSMLPPTLAGRGWVGGGGTHTVPVVCFQSWALSPRPCCLLEPSGKDCALKWASFQTSEPGLEGPVWLPPGFQPPPFLMSSPQRAPRLPRELWGTDLLLCIWAGLCPHPSFSFAPWFIVWEVCKWKYMHPGHKHMGGWRFFYTYLCDL